MIFTRAIYQTIFAYQWANYSSAIIALIRGCVCDYMCKISPVWSPEVPRIARWKTWLLLRPSDFVMRRSSRNYLLHLVLHGNAICQVWMTGPFEWSLHNGHTLAIVSSGEDCLWVKISGWRMAEIQHFVFALCFCEAFWPAAISRAGSCEAPELTAIWPVPCRAVVGRSIALAHQYLPASDQQQTTCARSTNNHLVGGFQHLLFPAIRGMVGWLAILFGMDYKAPTG